ncbi:response regulator [Ancylobacter sp. 6x-1]|uniref:Response regulator n=1 Tax=Ancylobacter crimeensis TaxID=2579147 RepID=A0ABT0DFI0_9HYPH|nr:response regulator [Ancylobacter crimeensis]MCK0198731.1 response regulator [Ancylobacter crimeensis]
MLAGKRIYIVDDDSGFLKGIERLLRAHGLRARTFLSAQAFEAEADLRDAACLIVDVHLGDVSGIDLIRRMLAGPAAVPFIVVTGNSSETTRLAAAAAGCCAYLEKPFSSKALLDSIRSAIELH